MLGLFPSLSVSLYVYCPPVSPTPQMKEHSHTQVHLHTNMYIHIHTYKVRKDLASWYWLPIKYTPIIYFLYNSICPFMQKNAVQISARLRSIVTRDASLNLHGTCIDLASNRVKRSNDTTKNPWISMDNDWSSYSIRLQNLWILNDDFMYPQQQEENCCLLFKDFVRYK